MDPYVEKGLRKTWLGKCCILCFLDRAESVGGKMGEKDPAVSPNILCTYTRLDEEGKFDCRKSSQP